MDWSRPNELIYRLAWLGRGALPEPRPRRRPRFDAAGDPAPILWATWGRIGDMLLQARVPDLLRTATGRPVVAMGRPEVEFVLAPHVDRFVALDSEDEEPMPAPAAVVTDLHFFHAAPRWLATVLDAIECEVKLTYEGHAPAARRPRLRSAQTVAALDDDERPHVLYHLQHYMAEVQAALGSRQPAPTVRDLCRAPAQVELVAEADDADHIACQIAANSARKTWPLARWRELFASFPRHRFVLLGSIAEREVADRLHAPNVRSLCGATSLPTALAWIARARAFVGPDSGLTHAAALLRRPTICVTHNSSLGRFFPYPDELGFDHLQVIAHERFLDCAGCGPACAMEPIWRGHKRGALCLREIGLGPVATALNLALMPAPGTRAGPAPAAAAR